jgi:hypothetical protein
MGASRAVKAPTTDHHERDTNHPLAVRRNGVERQESAHRNEQQADQHDAGGMTQAPVQASPPFDTIAPDGHGRDGGEMIGAGQNVKQAGGKARSYGKHE